MAPEWRGLLAAMLVALAAGCGAPLDDDQRLRDTIAEMEEALESGSVSDFMDSVADDFLADRAGLDRRALGLLVRRERLARTNLSIQRLSTEVEIVGGGRARAVIRALATGGSGWLPDEGRIWRIETGWRLAGDDWRLVSAGWEPVL
ncbi:MAG: hypothetical protein R3323_07000 [Wenzhouxiangellaceae bacterium]|nr:hypothetical protein [Wenzhouxiangellaceae bacterium]